ncbi:non-reduced type polyketide synthase protein [Apodospora peruviana]|uniref:Non-reduced type polyketide synthase protein n=1 Tax=Apodospora peruviana TaxID=516989 RepID=A0AAE0IDC2_9PEZI|nr:non-reduced type polyketide synthase protein [Apodospora peruviana]
MDPQQRLLLELSFEALHGAGYLVNHETAKRDDVGCFIGSSFVDYLDNTGSHAPTAYTSTGTIRAFLCGRICPAEVIDTACSSSLVAIYRAVRAIQAGECRMALAGGISLMTGINNNLDLAKANVLSTTGQCKPFGAAADGYCRADGTRLVVLKTVKDAMADGNEILGVVAGVATNQGRRSSITTPEPRAQQAFYKKVLDEAGIHPDAVSYVEAHGTGTQAGDPSEMESIRTVFGAAGVAGLLKVLAMLKHGKIPQQASFARLNPKIPALE